MLRCLAWYSRCPFRVRIKLSKMLRCMMMTCITQIFPWGSQSTAALAGLLAACSDAWPRTGGAPSGCASGFKDATLHDDQLQCTNICLGPQTAAVHHDDQQPAEVLGLVQEVSLQGAHQALKDAAVHDDQLQCTNVAFSQALSKMLWRMMANCSAEVRA